MKSVAIVVRIIRYEASDGCLATNAPKKGRSKGYPKRILWVRLNDFIGLFSLLFPKGIFLLPEKHHPSWLPVGYNLVPGVFPLESRVGPLAFSKEGKGLGTRLGRM